MSVESTLFAASAPDTILPKVSFFRVAGSHPTAGKPIPGGQIPQWILTRGPGIAREAEFFGELCWRLVGDGVPLWRATLHFGTLHPQIAGFAVRWWRDRSATEEIHIAHGADETDEYRRSPIRNTIERGAPFDQLLDGAASDYPLLDQIHAAGGTEYLALPLNRILRRYPVVTWTTDRAGGFADAHRAALGDLNPALAAIVETRAIRRLSANLMDTYLGPQAGRRVLAGHIRRGQGETLNAVIMAVDLRGFTVLSDRLAGDEMIELLDDYFDAVTSPIHERQGEVLKFIGDGVLAIFPTGEEGDFTSTTVRALKAAIAGLAKLDRINEARREADHPEIRIGVGLHLGEVTYGNVGAANRLDFTAIGPAVNLAARLEGLTKRVMRPLVTSSSFAAACPYPLISLGFHPVRGFSEPEEVFGLPE
ncbi:MAG TPA: adenylate/guanylate cyclase domain-containing protein [Stellaceae bacterium]|nr:adenylate/guanylate cyclase domain-containing protein [Stellaceae bacterium]